MKESVVVVIKNEQDGGIIRLSDGETYLIQGEDHSVAVSWPIGQLIHITRIDYPQNSFELRAEGVSNTARAILRQ